MRVSLPGLSASMRRVLAIGGSVVAGLVGWFLAASYLFVAMAELQGLLDRPWLAWWLYAANSPDGWTWTLLAMSGALPLVLVAAGAFAVWRLLRRTHEVLRRPLYGDSQWASEPEMLSAGIKQSRSPY
jgi:hypothetical protein